MSTSRNTAGFTLVEVLVTVLILGLLAAVVFPVVIPQVNKADPTKASNDLANIRSGIELFQLDVRPTEPGDVEDLSRAITTSDATVDGTTFTTGQTERWDGPYVDLVLTETTTAGPDDDGTSESIEVATETGFDAPLINDLFLYDTDKSVASNTEEGGANGTSDDSTGDFIAVRIVDLTADEFVLLNDQIDGENETATGTDGRLRFDGGPGTTTDLDDDGTNDDTITYFLAVPFKS